jgi:hypothetical protein
LGVTLTVPSKPTVSVHFVFLLSKRKTDNAALFVGGRIAFAERQVIEQIHIHLWQCEWPRNPTNYLKELVI